MADVRVEAVVIVEVAAEDLNVGLHRQHGSRRDPARDDDFFASQAYLDRKLKCPGSCTLCKARCAQNEISQLLRHMACLACGMNAGAEPCGSEPFFFQKHEPR